MARRGLRPFVVFGFGLFHGLGFASVLLDIGLPGDQFLTAMVGGAEDRLVERRCGSALARDCRPQAVSHVNP
ncbi:MAG: hypothetical protein EHM68_12810, partial [Lysobacterales bacterium]